MTDDDDMQRWQAEQDEAILEVFRKLENPTDAECWAALKEAGLL